MYSALAKHPVRVSRYTGYIDIRHGSRAVCRAAPDTTSQASVSLWDGSDAFSDLDDRLDKVPLTLPSIKAKKRIVVVRHGQSTWNAEGRIQGSTDFSVLTAKGKKQASKSNALLSGQHFDKLFVSPLARARETADIIWAPRPKSDANVQVVPQLREVDLYSFQGLLKHEGKARYGSAYQQWQNQPHAFEIDGHSPVRELWYRASLAWQTLLPAATSTKDETLLVVAHNAVNQALLAVALGLPPSYFRRLPQSNAALNVLELTPSAVPGAPPAVTLECLNQSPDVPFKDAEGATYTLVLVSPPATGSASAQKHNDACAHLLAHTKLKTVFTHGFAHIATAQVIVAAQQASHSSANHAALRELPPALDAATLWNQVLEACFTQPNQGSSSAVDAGISNGSAGATVALVVDPAVHAALLRLSLGLPAAEQKISAVAGSSSGHGHGHEDLTRAGAVHYKVSPGGISILEFSAPAAAAKLKCANNCAHLE